jgi:hypothetical protein
MASKRKRMDEWKHRKAVQPVFTGRFAPKIVGVSDTVLMSTTASAKAARQAERNWKRTLSKGERRKLRSA